MSKDLELGYSFEDHSIDSKQFKNRVRTVAEDTLLTERQAAVFLLHKEEGFTVREAGRVLGFEKGGTATSHYGRAKKKITDSDKIKEKAGKTGELRKLCEELGEASE